MYRDGYEETGLQRFARAISKSFRLGRFFDVEVRVFWLALVVMPLILLRNVEGLPFVEGLTYIALTTGALFLVIWTHEMGHILAGRRYGIRTPLITLSPLGGLAHMSSGAPSPRKEMVVALAGPATHLLWLVPVLPLYLLLDYGALRPASWWTDPGVGLVHTLLWLNGALLVFNLLPFFPMDGGRVFRAFLAQKHHPNRATLTAVRVGTIGGWVFIVAGIVLWITSDDLYGPVLAAIGIANLMACKQEKIAALHGPGPYMQADVLQPWQVDPEAWKTTGGAPSGGSAKRSERAERKRQKKREQEAADAAALEAELDRVLDRVSTVGLDGLTRKERAILARASERRRKK
jgi:Zn-dependent protease